jgi:hypothetical protein
MWAAVQISEDVNVCASILRGQPVIASKLDRAVLHRAFRGQVPDEQFVMITPEQLDAVAEAGPIPETERRR